MSDTAKKDQQIAALQKARTHRQQMRDALHDSAQADLHENPSLQAVVDQYDAAFTERLTLKNQQQRALHAFKQSLEAAGLPPEEIAFDMQLIAAELRRMKNNRV